jgi:DNA-binding phage protein
MPRIVVPVKEEMLRAAERRRAAGVGEDIVQFLAELIEVGFEPRLQQLYQRCAAGEMSLGYVANELGLNLRDLYAALEQRGLPTSNIGAQLTAEGKG